MAEKDAKPADKSEADPKDPLEGIAGWVVGGLALLITALGAFAGLTGGVARMLRNQPVASPFAIGLVVVAIFLALASKVMWTRWLLLAAALATTVGIVWALTLMVNTTSGTDLPQAAAKFSEIKTGGLLLSGTVSATSMKSNAPLQVVVYEQPEAGAVRRLYFGATGADQEGSAKQSFEIIIPFVPDGVAAYVVSASISETPRTCDQSRFIYVANHADDDTPPTAPARRAPKDSRDERVFDVNSACLVLEPPVPAGKG
jgi:hypothetical protein